MCMMENTDNLLVNRQLEVARKNLVTVFRFAVKALIDKACFCSVDDGCEEFINFSAAMEQVLHHRLRPSRMWHLGDNKNHFWFYIKSACHRHDLRSCITNIDNIENIKSPVGKGRAFLRCALMEKRLADYLGEALKQTSVTRRFYQEGAIMLGEEAAELCGVLVGLNSIDFGFCLKGENYDSVPGPLAVNYSPFMKFKQSPESLYSDMEEMRELSCESSLASEDGQEGHDGTADTWQDRYNLLHKRYTRLLEQKSFLEELTATQEKGLQVAAAAQQEQLCLQQEAKQQQRQYEAVILELQAQVARMKAVNESLQRQLMLARHSRVPMSEMEFRGESQVDASRFAAALVYRQDSEQNSLNSSYDRAAAAPPVDTRSLASAVSELSGEAMPGISGIQMEGGLRHAEDTQSMVPLTGSLSDIHSTAHDITSISSIPAETASAATESTTSRPSIMGSHLTSPSHTEELSLACEGRGSEEVNGNSVSSVKTDSTSVDAPDLALSSTGSEVRERSAARREEDESEGTDGRELEEEEEEARERREMASVWHDGLQESIVILRGPSSNYSQEESLDVDTDSAVVGTPSEVKDLVDDSEMTEDRDMPSSVQNDLISSMVSSSEDVDSFRSDAQPLDAGQEMTGSGPSTEPDRHKGEGSEPDVACKDSPDGAADDARDVKDGSDPEDLSAELTGDKDDVASGHDEDDVAGGHDEDDVTGDSGKDDVAGCRDEDDVAGDSGKDDVAGCRDEDDVAGGSGKDGVAGCRDEEDVASGSDKGSGSEPEVLSQGSAGVDSVNGSDKGETSEPEVLSQGSAGGPGGAASTSDKGETSEPEILSQESAEGNTETVDQEKAAEEHAPSQEQDTAGDRDGTGSGSDSSGSDIAKETWDMLSDANHDSN